MFAMKIGFVFEKFGVVPHCEIHSCTFVQHRRYQRYKALRFRYHFVSHPTRWNNWPLPIVDILSHNMFSIRWTFSEFINTHCLKSWMGNNFTFKFSLKQFSLYFSFLDHKHSVSPFKSLCHFMIEFASFSFRS